MAGCRFATTAAANWHCKCLLLGQQLTNRFLLKEVTSIDEVKTVKWYYCTHWRLAMNFRISCWAYCLSLKKCWFGLWHIVGKRGHVPGPFQTHLEADMDPKFLNTYPITWFSAIPEISVCSKFVNNGRNQCCTKQSTQSQGAYPPDNPLPRYAASNHQAYALRHGYRALAVWKNQSILHHNELEGNGMTSGCCADGWCCFSRGYRLETEKVSPERPPAWGHLAGETHGRRNAAEVKIVVHLSDGDSIWFIYPGFVSVFFCRS